MIVSEASQVIFPETMMQIRILNVQDGNVSIVPHLRIATDNNGPVWVSNTDLLIQRYR